MRQIQRVSEYYDLFDVKATVNGSDSRITGNATVDIVDPNSQIQALPDDIVYKNSTTATATNPFRGFWNNKFYNYNGASDATNTPNDQKAKDIAVIKGTHKAPQAVNQLRIDENGDIWCYPPNVSVPYWTRIIFRNYDYSINMDEASSKYLGMPKNKSSGKSDALPFYYDNGAYYPIPRYNHGIELWNKDCTLLAVDAPYQHDFTGISGVLEGVGSYEENRNETPLFLKFDEYPSRSKVIFSQSDKTRNPDIEHRFSYHKGQMEPIKLNLSFTASQYINDEISGDRYNVNLSRLDMFHNISKCYWCIEWIYEPETH